MKKVIVASLNPVKLAAARLSFAQVWPAQEFDFLGVAADSGISSQPLSDAETLQGALNRLQSAQTLQPGADYYIAFEGGVEDKEGELEEFAWTAVTDANGTIGRGKSATFIAPPGVRNLVIEQKMESGLATDVIFKQQNSKQKMGLVGVLTNNLITRTDFYVQPGILALLPFSNPDLY